MVGCESLMQPHSANHGLQVATNPGSETKPCKPLLGKEETLKLQLKPEQCLGYCFALVWKQSLWKACKP